MTKKTILLAGAISVMVGACSPLTYSSHKKVATYEYDGVIYDVYRANRQTAGRKAVSVFRLVDQRVDPKALDTHTVLRTGDFNGAVAECAGSLEDCRTEFGAALERKKNPAKSRDESGMGY